MHSRIPALLSAAALGALLATGGCVYQPPEPLSPDASGEETATDLDATPPAPGADPSPPPPDPTLSATPEPPTTPTLRSLTLTQTADPAAPLTPIPATEVAEPTPKVTPTPTTSQTPPPAPTSEITPPVDADGDGLPRALDCDDEDPRAGSVVAEEVCDEGVERDNDCDGVLATCWGSAQWGVWSWLETRLADLMD